MRKFDEKLFWSFEAYRNSFEILSSSIYEAVSIMRKISPGKCLRKYIPSIHNDYVIGP